jgi:hypothetical protein
LRTRPREVPLGAAHTMRNRRRQNTPIEALRLAIDCMPVHTREAMLAAVRASDRIIAGAYVDRQGGVCPMLAAHRNGGRTDFISFARSWDRFTRAGSAREATRREVGILIAHLEASLQSVTGFDLDQAIKEHRELRGRRLRRHRALAHAADPTGEIIARRIQKTSNRRSRGERRVSAADGRSQTPALLPD